MTIKELFEIAKVNNVPDDCILLSDSGWEGGDTPMTAAYYNKEQNAMVFTQGGRYEKEKYDSNERSFPYSKRYGWDLLFVDESQL